MELSVLSTIQFLKIVYDFLSFFYSWDQTDANFISGFLFADHVILAFSMRSKALVRRGKGGL